MSNIIKTTHGHEKAIAKCIQEVRDIQAANLSRWDLLKRDLTSGVGGLVAVDSNVFLPNLAFAIGNSSPSGSTSTKVISPPCNKPWTDPLPIPKARVSVSSFSGPGAERRWNPGKMPTTISRKPVLKRINVSMS